MRQVEVVKLQAAHFETDNTDMLRTKLDNVRTSIDAILNQMEAMNELSS